MKKDITIKDVAKAAGVSIATVSRVINENPTVNPEIKKKVLEAIKKLNYLPNNAARSLKTQNTETIAYLVTNISDYFFTAISRGIEQVIKEYNYNLLVCSNENSKETELQYLKMLQEKKVSGIILNTTGYNNEYIAEISQMFPVVLSNRKIPVPTFRGDFVDFDNSSSTLELTNHLISLGHKKIGVVNGPLHLSTAYERYRGFIMGMKKIGIDIDENYQYNYNHPFTLEGGYKGAQYLMEMDDPPTALILMSSELALGAMKYFVSNEIKIPDDVSIVSFGDILNKELLFINPTLSYTDLNSFGNKLGKVMIERINNRDLNNREFRFMTTLQYGNSTRKIN